MASAPADGGMYPEKYVFFAENFQFNFSELYSNKNQEILVCLLDSRALCVASELLMMPSQMSVSPEVSMSSCSRVTTGSCRIFNAVLPADQQHGA